MSSRAALIQAKSLYTFSNELNLPEGALVIAKNINIDEPSVITPRRGFNDYGSALPTADDRVKQLMQYKGKVIRHYDDVLQWENSSNDFTSFLGSYLELEDGLRLKYQESNGNLYFTTIEGIKKIAATASSDFNNISITDAGGIKAVDLSAMLQPTVGGFIPTESKVAYRIVFGIKDINNNVITGDPSSRFILTNSSADISVPEKSKITVISVAAISSGASDYIIFDTPTVGYALWFNKTGTQEEPQNADLLGRIVIEVDASGATTADIAASIATTISKNIATVEVELNASEVVVTNIEAGDAPNIMTNNVGAFTVASTIDGSITEGSTANSLITFTIPSGITNKHFYQIFRTAAISVTEGINELSDLDPGEEYNQVYEAGITTTDISNGEITVEDITTETFRLSGLPLYTNPITGQGILQSNSRPPLAKDIALFRNSMFYANTKLNHRLEINILSVDDIVSGFTEFIIGNNDGIYTYTFVGTPESTVITADTFANTTNGGYIEINSSNDERGYYIYLDKGDFNETITTITPSGTDTIIEDVGHGLSVGQVVYISAPSSTPAINGNYTITSTTANTYTVTLTLSAGDATSAYYYVPSSNRNPNIVNKIGIRVDISLAVTAQEVKDAIDIAILNIVDFIYSDEGGNDFKILNANNGNSTDTTISGLGGAWALGAIVQGTGEDAGNNEVLASGLISVSQAIDETARSLVRIINKDALSPVIATYLSSEGTLPGQILLENKNLEDNPFFLATNDVTFQSELNPELPLLEALTDITPSGAETIFEDIGHSLFIGDEVYISAPNSFPAVGAKYRVKNTTANTFTVDLELQTGDDTDAFYWLASIESDNVESPNRIYFSKVSQPEAVPIVNYIDIGPQDEPIERIVSLRDNLMVFKTDGIYILTGSSALTGFSVRLLDNTSRLVAPDSAAVLDNQIFCLTTEGIATVTETGVGVISRPIENRIFDIVNSRFDYTHKIFGVSYTSDKAYILFMPEKVTDQYSTQCYRYNTYERSFTRWDVSATCGLLNNTDDKLYLGAGDRQYTLKERKNGDRTDNCDRSFILQIPDNAVTQNKVRLSNVSNITEGDVLLQEQYVTISQYNRLLRSLDIDSGLTDSDYESTLKASYGNNLAIKLAALNVKLEADDSSGTITIHTFLNSNWQDMQDKFNDLIDELNSPLCDTLIKNYDKAEEIVPYEAIITKVDAIKNLVYLNFELPLVEGNIELFKAYETVTQWSPQHFGDPSGTKQIREGTIMFDQNNFYSAFLAFSSDLSASFVEDSFRGKGTGYFGYGEYGSANLYWGGNGNDIPYRTIIPRDKQRCRYLNVRFRHKNARENWRIVGVSAVVKPVSSRGYR